ncbi:T cell receptor gamma 2, partial [Clarias magur]
MSNVTTACFLLALIGCVSGQFEVQTPWEIGRKGRIKRLGCTVDSSVSLSSTPIHWYRGKPGEAMERILHFAAGATKPTIESKFARRFNS